MTEIGLAWLLVSLAIAVEIIAALSLRFSQGFTKPLPTVVALGAFGSAFYLISLALVTLPVSTVYPVWAGGGTAGVALLGVLALREKANVEKGLGIVLVVTGIVTNEATGDLLRRLLQAGAEGDAEGRHTHPSLDTWISSSRSDRNSRRLPPIPVCQRCSGS